jgi:anaphase-promoting complex subunit 1
MIFGRTLHLFNLDHEDNKLVMKPIPDQIKFPAISMAAVVATRRDVKDLLVMRPDGSLRLFAHDGNGIDVDIEDNEGRDDGNISVEMVPGEDIEMSPASPRITRASLSSPARSSVNLVYTDGSSTRLSTHLYPQSIPVALSFQALAFVLPSPTLWAVRMEYLKRRRFGNEREEWRAFEDAVLEIVSAGGVTAAEEEEARRVQAEGENDAWTALADSTAHSKFSSNSAISGLSLPAASSKRVLSSPGAASNHAPFLWALHLLGEDLKFNVSYHYQITMLAPLLIKLAKMVRWEWADYWARWCPEAADGWDGVQVPRTSSLTFSLNPLILFLQRLPPINVYRRNHQISKLSYTTLSQASQRSQLSHLFAPECFRSSLHQWNMV